MLPAAARVADMHTEIRVAKSGELTITERITVVAPEGRQTRQTAYRASRRIAFLADHDALHWNLKGAERITAEVVLPESVPARQIRPRRAAATLRSSFATAAPRSARTTAS